MIGKNIKEARHKQGMTQLALAKLVGVNRVSIARFEMGDREPSISCLREIARVLGVPLQDLVREDER